MTTAPDGFVVGPVFGRSSTSVRPSGSRALRRAARVAAAESPGPLELVHGTERAPLPPDVARLVEQVLRELDAGRSLTLVVGTSGPDADLSSQQVADVLNVSRPHVVKLAREGAIAHTKVGNRHRFRLADVLDYQRDLAERRQRLLASLEPEGGFGDDDY